MPPRKRRHNQDDDDDDEENSLDAENGVRSKRKAAVQARAKAVQDKGSDEDEDSEEEEDDDEEDEDFNDGEDEEEEEGDEPKDGVEGDEDEDDNEDEEDEDEDVDADAIKVECVEAVLEEPTKEVEGYVLKKKDGTTQKLEMWFSEEMSETVGDINEAFGNHYESDKLPVLQVTKFDVIEERDEIYQIDVLEAKFDKAYAIREKEKDSDDDSNLAHDLHCLVRVEGKDNTWATQYFMPDDDEE